MTKSRPDSVTIRDVAQRAGVSVATVSRYINQTTPVSDEAAQRLERAMAELQFIPHAAARRLATNTTNTLGLLITQMHTDFFAPLLSGIEEATGEAGYDLLISTSRRIHKRFPFPLGPSNADGLLVFAGSMSASELKRTHELEFPVVLIHQTPPLEMDIPCVTVENKDASLKIVSHLIEAHARRRIVFLSGPEEHEDAHWRELGYREALASHNLEIDASLVVPGNFDRNVACESIQKLLVEGIRFDAIFTGDDEAAVGVLAALQEAGLRVPEEVAVVGFDDQRMAPYLSPPLTTVRAPTEEVGRVAVRQLVNLIREGQAEPLVLLPTEIVLRHSCGCH
jgi:LacI family transcriptional regulator